MLSTSHRRKAFGTNDHSAINKSAADNDDGRRGGNVVLQQDPQIQLSNYQQALDEGTPNPQVPSTDTVRYWSDFNRIFYHPRSIVQINDYELGSKLLPFEEFNNG